MRISFEEPMGVWVRGGDGEAVVMPFPAFVAAVKDGMILTDDQVWSHIVTDGRWVRAGGMRLFQMLTAERLAARQTVAQVGTPPSSPSASACAEERGARDGTP